MTTWNTVLRHGLVDGTAASLLSTAALMAMGRREAGSAYAPTNATSHWIWGDQAFRHTAPSVRHTVTGYVIHHACSTFWAVGVEHLCGRLFDRKQPSLTLGVGAAASAVACFVDYRCTPKRLMPGYEQHLSRPALAVVYAAFAAGMALGAMLGRRA